MMNDWCHSGSRLLILDPSQREQTPLAATVVRHQERRVLVRVERNEAADGPRLGVGDIVRLALPRGDTPRLVAITSVVALSRDARLVVLNLPDLSWHDGLRSAVRIPDGRKHEIARLSDLKWQTVQGVDLSVSGALVEGFSGPALGTTCLMRLSLPDGELEVEARVVRREAQRLGLSFLTNNSSKHERLRMNLQRLERDVEAPIDREALAHSVA